MRTKGINWETYAKLLQVNNQADAVRKYIEIIMRMNRVAFIKQFANEGDYNAHLKGLKAGAWLTDDDMTAFAASLGFRLTFVLKGTKGTEVPPYETPLDYAGFSVDKEAPSRLVINENYLHWNPHETEVPGDGSCGAHTLAYCAESLKNLAPETVRPHITYRVSGQNPESRGRPSTAESAKKERMIDLTGDDTLTINEQKEIARLTEKALKDDPKSALDFYIGRSSAGIEGIQGFITYKAHMRKAIDELFKHNKLEEYVSRLLDGVSQGSIKRDVLDNFAKLDPGRLNPIIETLEQRSPHLDKSAKMHLDSLSLVELERVTNAVLTQVDLLSCKSTRDYLDNFQKNNPDKFLNGNWTQNGLVHALSVCAKINPIYYKIIVAPTKPRQGESCAQAAQAEHDPGRRVGMTCG